MTAVEADFPAADHDHGRCLAAAMARAEQRCAEHGLRLTPQRRRVLEIVAASHTAVGAYEILARMGEEGRLPAPVSVYRALEFLVRHGLAHRVESLNAFIACLDDAHGPQAQFLICQHCRTVAEISSPEIEAAISAGAEKVGFVAGARVVEIRGLCRNCARVGRDARAH
jgi:Fur family transcriptional regulator, zinc uptake regulator